MSAHRTPVLAGHLPEGLPRMECFTAYKVLERIREQVLTGRPSGRVIDTAMAELLDLAGEGGGRG